MAQRITESHHHTSKTPAAGAKQVRTAMTQDTQIETTQRPLAEVIDLESLRAHRNLVHVREWLQAQLPWQRGEAHRISERIRAA